MEVTKQTTEFATADPKQKLLRAGFEPATYGYLTMYNYSPPLYQLSYRRGDEHCTAQHTGYCDWLAMTFKSKCHPQCVDTPSLNC